MFLKSLRLNNIRSYVDQTINFPQGKVLLSGDIGAGKSTILLAIEFALFGMKRGITSGTHLLRHGSDFGAVELHFTLNNQNIVINRPLKRTKDGVKQEAGYFIINNTKTDATAVELRAKILELLGYPDDVLNKANDYLYRYTVFTPQEEMKAIFNDTQENRLDTLRKIFNIDKYKNVRENTQIITRELKAENKLLNERVLLLSEHEQKKKQLENEIREIRKQQEELNVKHEELQSSLIKQQQELQLQEKIVEQQRQYQQELRSITESEEHFKQQQQRLEMQHQNYQQQIHLLEEKLQHFKQEQKPEHTEETLLERRDALQKERDAITQKREMLKQQMNFLRSQVKSVVEEITVIEHRTKEKQALQEEIATLQNSLQEKDAVTNGLKEVLQQKEQLVQAQAMLAQKLATAAEIKRKISTLDTCPLCLQQVTEQHKHTIEEEQQSKFQECLKQQVTYEQQQKSLGIQIGEQENALNEFMEKEKRLLLSNNKHNELTGQEKILEKKRMILEEYESTLIKTQLESENLSKQPIEEKEKEVQHLTQLLLKVRMFQQQQQERAFVQATIQDKKNEFQRLEEELNRIKEQRTSLETQRQNLQQLLKATEGAAEKYTQLKQECEKAAVQLHSIQLKQASITAELETKQSFLSQVEQHIKTSSAARDQMNKNHQLLHWLTELFIPLTSTIEKTILLKIYHEFNGYFTHWFAQLMEDETLTARLDDTFTPYLEQNGYDTDFENLSGGEKTAVALAYRLALNKVINEFMVHILTKGILILDEPTDGFSAEQLDRVKDVLDQLSLDQVIIVSHENKVESYVDTVVRVLKEGHVSKVLS